MVVVAWRESAFRANAVGDGGLARCAFQLHGAPRSVLTDLHKCTELAATRLRASALACPSAPARIVRQRDLRPRAKAERLADARGGARRESCTEGHSHERRPSRGRKTVASLLLDTRPVRKGQSGGPHGARLAVDVPDRNPLKLASITPSAMGS